MVLESQSLWKTEAVKQGNEKLLTPFARRSGHPGAPWTRRWRGGGLGPGSVRAGGRRDPAWSQGRESVLSHGAPQLHVLKPNPQRGLRGEAFGV